MTGGHTAWPAFSTAPLPTAPADPDGLPPLRDARFTAAAWAAQCRSAQPVLGALAWGPLDTAEPGATPAGANTPLATSVLPLLAPARACVDAWLGGPVLRAGRSGAVQWHSDGHWAFGHVEFPDVQVGLEETARLAYQGLFGALRDSGCTQVLRLWNYLPRITEDGGGLERYRQFNAGRQRAFIEAGYSAFEGAPAACALGTHGGGLALRFLAGKTAPVAIENPRQVPAYRYSAAYGPRSPTFSRAAVAAAGGGRVALWVSGTASIVGEHTVHHGDVPAQLAETLTNLHAVIAAANQRCTAGFTLAGLVCTVYVRHVADLAFIRAAFEAAVGPDSLAARQAIYLQADVCRSDLLLEIEGHALAPGVLC